MYFPGVDIEYDTDYECARNPEVCANDYCRCSTIENIRAVGEPDFEEYIKQEFPKTSEIEQYCIERLMTLNGYYDLENFTANAYNDYYGQSIGDTYFRNQDVMDTQIAQMLYLNSDMEKISFILNAEYDEVLSCVPHLKYKVDTIDRAIIMYSNPNHKKRAEHVSRYNNYNYPLGIVRELRSDVVNYLVIDGYHRIKQASGQKLKVIVGYV